MGWGFYMLDYLLYGDSHYIGISVAANFPENDQCFSTNVIIHAECQSPAAARSQTLNWIPSTISPERNSCWDVKLQSSYI